MVNPFMIASTWQVYDVNGRLIQIFELSSHETKYAISVKGLSPGLYMLKGFSGSHSFTSRFVVEN